jgi:predicted Zn-dependent peptidase
LSSEYNIIVTARPTPQGTTVAAQMDRIRGIVDEEIGKIQQTAPAAREFQRAINQIESSFYDRMERIGGGSGIADQMNTYYTYMGDPNYFNADLSRYRAIAPADVTATAAKYLALGKRVELIVEPAK